MALAMQLMTCEKWMQQQSERGNDERQTESRRASGNEGGKMNIQQPPNNITFCDTSNGYQREVLRITKDGIKANPDVPVDDAAAAVIRALDGYIKNLTQRT
jgi:hypothetical protein